MTTYRLPDWLGGHKCRSVNEGDKEVLVEIDQYESHRIIVPRDLLTEVKPPLPPEPEDGYVGRAGRFVWERDDRAEQQGEAGPGKHWWRPGDDRTYTWEAVHEINTNAGADLVRLVADPADDAPELPWAIVDGEMRLLVEAAGKDIRVAINNRLGQNLGFRLSHWHGSKLAAAVLAAQRRAQENERANRTGAAREVEQP